MAKTTPATKQKQDSKRDSVIAPNTKLTLTIDAQTAQEAYKKALNRLAKRLKLDGFRPGRVPAARAEEALGTEQVVNEALQRVVPPAYQQLLEKEKKQPLTQPDFKVVSAEKGKSWEIEVQIAERPDVSVTNYKKLARDARTAAHKDLEKQLKEQQKQQKPKEKAPTKTKAQGTETNTSAENAQPPEPTEQQKQDFIVQRVYQHLVTELQPRIPELLLREEVQYDLRELNQQLQQIGMTLQDYLQRRQVSEQDLSNELAARALGRLQLTLLLQEIAKDAKIEVKPEEIDASIEETKNPQMIAQKNNPEYRALVGQTLQRKQVAEYLMGL